MFGDGYSEFMEYGAIDAFPNPGYGATTGTPAVPTGRPGDQDANVDLMMRKMADVFVVWTSLGPLPRWVLGPITRWAPGTTRLVPHGTCWCEAQGLRWRSTRIGSYTYHVLCRGLLDLHD
jgi:hypothetical protein